MENKFNQEAVIEASVNHNLERSCARQARNGSRYRAVELPAGLRFPHRLRIRLDPGRNRGRLSGTGLPCREGRGSSLPSVPTR